MPASFILVDARNLIDKMLDVTGFPHVSMGHGNILNTSDFSVPETQYALSIDLSSKEWNLGETATEILLM
jgi:hypothetical protein